MREVVYIIRSPLLPETFPGAYCRFGQLGNLSLQFFFFLNIRLDWHWKTRPACCAGVHNECNPLQIKSSYSGDTAAATISNISLQDRFPTKLHFRHIMASA